MIQNGISLMMQALGRRYVRYFNCTYQRTGTLWEGRFKSCVICAEEYFFICQRYIELNPVRANMVSHPAEYKWSSYRFHAQETLELQSGLWQPHELYLKLSRQQRTRAKRYQALFKHHIPEEELGRIRNATQSDMALGNGRFKEEIEALTGRRVTPKKRGRKPSQMG
ncbi:transposase [Marinomonas gallaica]|uniref:transposase n=1 Tax=Marinomonas gallaica TaxID=1806667 RepID=UPI003A8F48BB